MHRGVLAEVALQPDRPELGVPGMEPFEHLPGPVGRAVVDEDDLVGAAEALERLDRLAVDLLQRGLLVVDGNDERDVRPLDLRKRLTRCRNGLHFGHFREATSANLEPVTLNSVQTQLDERVERIANDDTHGASWLANEAVEAVCEAIELGEDPIALGKRLVKARPAMGAIAGALGRVLAGRPHTRADGRGGTGARRVA